MYLDSSVVPVDFALLAGLVYTCPALKLPRSDNPSRRGRGVSNGRMATLLVERRVRVLQIRCGCGTDLIKDSKPPPSCQSSLGACPSLPTLRRSILPSVLHLFQMVLPRCGGYSPPQSQSNPLLHLQTCS